LWQKWPHLLIDHADAIPVRFPNGDRGVLVVLGDYGPTFGDLVLYRIHGETVTLVDAQEGAVDWGGPNVQKGKTWISKR